MPPELTPERWSELGRVQRDVNSRVSYRSDPDLYGLPEFWEAASPGGEGDCEDYALAKRLALLALGWPLESLRLAVCLDETRSGHAVLTVDTDRGTYALDNRRAQVVPWGDLPYSWIQRQAAGRPEWVYAGPR